VSLSVKSGEYLKGFSYFVAKTETFNMFSGTRKDLFSIGDLLAINGKEILLVQVTSRGNISARKKKAEGNILLQVWLLSGGVFEIHGWDKYNDRWRLKIIRYKGKEVFFEYER
jgi:hypothetical protein